MSWVDVAILTALIVSTILGLFWGLIRRSRRPLAWSSPLFFWPARTATVAGAILPSGGGRRKGQSRTRTWRISSPLR